MNGFKAKVVKRIAYFLESDRPGYVSSASKPFIGKVLERPGLPPVMYRVYAPIRRASEARRLYKRMKRDLSRGGQ